MNLQISYNMFLINNVFTIYLMITIRPISELLMINNINININVYD